MSNPRYGTHSHKYSALDWTMNMAAVVEYKIWHSFTQTFCFRLNNEHVWRCTIQDMTHIYTNILLRSEQWTNLQISNQRYDTHSLRHNTLDSTVNLFADVKSKIWHKLVVALEPERHDHQALRSVWQVHWHGHDEKCIRRAQTQHVYPSTAGWPHHLAEHTEWPRGLPAWGTTLCRSWVLQENLVNWCGWSQQNATHAVTWFFPVLLKCKSCLWHIYILDYHICQ